VNNLLEVFDAWEPLVKARKAKGLQKWDKLQGVAHKLEGKQSKHISFTCGHPSHKGSAVKHNLGSTKGNLHFLLGYASPGFHVMPYHYQVIDPLLDDEEAENQFKHTGNPSNPRLWAQAEIDAEAEGEVEEGQAHPAFQETNGGGKKGIEVNSNLGKYKAVPADQVVYSLHNDHQYRWDLVKDSYFAATNPEMSDAMNASEVKKGGYLVAMRKDFPDMVKHQALPGEFAEGVYSLVKSHCPKPGSIIPVSLGTLEEVYGVVRGSSIAFFDREGASIALQVYDRSYDSLDLKKGGDIHPSILLNFMEKHLGLDTGLLKSFVENTTNEEEDGLPSVVLGTPSPGFEEKSATAPTA
jgi:hypothetical protein